MMTSNTGVRPESVRFGNVAVGLPAARRYRAALALLIMMFGATATAQMISAQRVFVLETVTRQVASQFSQNWAVNSYLISEGSFDPDNNGRFEHEELFRQMFTRYVPATYTGPVCLNWEGLAMANLLQSPVSSFSFDQTIEEYLKLLALAKELRPNAKIGFYNIPMREYWNRDRAWQERNLALMPIAEASDCLFPSVYDFYKTGQWSGHTAQQDLDYVRECVQIALDMADGKPVYPFISTRYHLSNQAYGMRLIPSTEFKSHIRAVFAASNAGDRADGLVWFGADRYYRWLAQQTFAPAHPQYWMGLVCRAVFAAEIPANVSDDDYFTDIHRRTLRQISDVITGEL